MRLSVDNSAAVHFVWRYMDTAIGGHSGSSSEDLDETTGRHQAAFLVVVGYAPLVVALSSRSVLGALTANGGKCLQGGQEYKNQEGLGPHWRERSGFKTTSNGGRVMVEKGSTSLRAPGCPAPADRIHVRSDRPMLSPQADTEDAHKGRQVHTMYRRRSQSSHLDGIAQRNSLLRLVGLNPRRTAE